MISYVTLGTSDLERAKAFYDTLLAMLRAKRLMERPDGNGIVWGTEWTKPAVGVMKPHDGSPATAGNGTMVALITDSKEQVHAMHEQALALGGADEGQPGPRGTGGFYGAYFRDLDGNKLAVFAMVPPAA